MSKQITITISDNQVSDIKGLMLHMRDTSTLEHALGKVIEQGITQLTYRYRHNKLKVQKERENKQLLEMLLREREERLKKEQEKEDEIVARD